MAINLLESFRKLLAGKPETNKTPEVAVLNKVTAVFGQLPNPDSILRKAGKDISVYRELLGDDEVWSAVQSFKSGVKSLEWELYGTETNQARKDEIQALFDSWKIDTLISQILNARLFGFQPLEITWQTQNGKWWPVNIQEKPIEWFTFNTQGKLCLKPQFRADGGKDPLEVPYLAFIVPQHEATYANPWGEAILSRVFWAVAFKKGGVKFWVTFMEKYGMPWVTGKMPRGAQISDQNELLTKLDAMVQDAVAVIPDDSSIEIHQTGSSTNSGDLHPNFINFFIGQINKVILSQTLTGNSGNGNGSYALGKVHGEIREDVVDVGKRMVEEVFNTLIGWIYQFNYGIPAALKFRLFEEEDVDKTLAERDEVLTRTGVTFKKSYFVKTYGLDEEDFEVNPQVDNSEFSHKPNCSCGCQKVASQNQASQSLASFADQSQTRMDADSIQEALDQIGQTTNLQPLLNATLRPVLAAFENLSETTTPDELFEQLAQSYPDLSTQALEDSLTKAIFLADILGRLTDKAEQ